MFPADDNLDYPKFIANQVLQSKHLNDLFDYLDEQNRLTRTNLIGIGILCGLDVVPIGSNQIKITKGVGITSAGYEVVVQEKTYQGRKPYTVPAEIEYLPFYNKPLKANKFLFWELTEGSPAGSTPLDAVFLSGNGNEDDRKVVLMFVELLLSNNKNCSPNSCDDKGGNVIVSFKPLLMRKADAIILLNAAKALEPNVIPIPDASVLLPDFKMKRFDVLKTNISTAQNIIDGYRNILTKDFVLAKVKQNWINAYNIFQSALGLSPNLFLGWNPVFAPDNKIQLTNAYEYQYFYDFISDLLEVYEELQIETGGMLSICCPDEQLFPRHLFLGLSTENTLLSKSDFRNYFNPSPILKDKNLIKSKIISLFKKAFKLLSFAVPNPPQGVRITPSKYGDFRLSEKAIPYYYDVLGGGAESLFRLWNYQKTNTGKSKNNLSYFGADYPAPKPDFVSNPLLFDLEPYNFFRIEGHVGKNYQSVLAEITNLRNTNRLPFDIVAIRTGDFVKNSDVIQNYDCHFNDLEINYDVARREWECCIGLTIEYLDDVLPSAEIIGSRKNRLKNFTKQLVKAKKYMVDALPDFVKKWSNFIVDYEAIENEAKEIRKLLEGDLIDANRDRDSTSDDFSIEDLIDHLDDVILSCQKGPFRAIFQEYKRRLGLIKEKFLLKNYANAHVGLQHKAGVTVGGTFIIVYDEIPKMSSLVFADFFLPYLCCSDCSGSQVVIETAEPPAPIVSPLSASIIGEPKCDITGSNYSVQILVLGGKPPYKANDVGFSGNIFTEITPNGQSNLVVITDADTPPKNVTVPINNFTCPQPQVSPLTASIIGEPKCNATGTSYTVQILVLGGKPPYKANNVGFTGNIRTETLNSGTGRTIIITDEEASTADVNITINNFTCPQPIPPPQPLILNRGTEDCEEDKESYRVNFSISGGTPPYFYNGSPVGISFRDSFRSGETNLVQVLDNKGVNSNAILIQPFYCCPFPCDGKLLTCEYLFIPVQKEGSEFEVVFNTFEFDGMDFSMNSRNFNENPNKVIFSQSFPSYENFREAFAESLNQEIIKIVSDKNKELIRFISEASQQENFIKIASFQCNDFVIKVSIAINQERFFICTFTENGVEIFDGKNTIAAPKFNCVLEERCGQNEPQRLCKEGLGIERILHEKITNDPKTVQFEVRPQIPGAKYLWIFDAKNGANPSDSNLVEPRIGFSKEEKEVRVTVYVFVNGCMDKMEKTIQIV